jgi:hypothetical protein
MKIDLDHMRTVAHAAASRYRNRHAAFCSSTTLRGYVALLP